MYSVFIEALDIYAYHGVPAEERIVGHRYHIDIEMAVNGTADETDSIEGTVDYGEAAKIASHIVQSEQFFTVEKLAATIGDHLLKSFPLVERTTVTIRKPFPPAPIIAASVGATVVRER